MARIPIYLSCICCSQEMTSKKTGWDQIHAGPWFDSRDILI
uniref:Uncharacterized protein n=1 Tax=Anguilla anguilla TaxID=7936 RepID=A0A0E9TEM8_ANGAN